MTTASDNLTAIGISVGRGKKPVLIAVAAAVGLLVLLLVAWAIDGAGARTARGLKLGDRIVAGTYDAIRELKDGTIVKETKVDEKKPTTGKKS